MDAIRALDFSDLVACSRTGDPRLSPKGTEVVFPVTRPDFEANRNETQIYRLPAAGGAPVRLTTQGTINNTPSFSPDGAFLAFTSNRSGTNQIWILPTAGGEARQVTRLTLGASRPVWFPDGKRLLAVSPVYGERGDEAAIEAHEKERERFGGTARVIDALMYRHWDTWSEDRVDHLFVIDAASGEARDLTPGPYPVPPRSLSGDPDYAVSPDGGEVCFVSLRHPDQALSTNLNLWTVSAEGGDPVRISPGEGCNVHPVYSPDGTSIAYCAMARAGYEADRLALVLRDRESGVVREIAPGFDRSAGAPVFSPDGKTLYFAAEDEGATRIFRVSAAGGDPEPLTGGATDGRPTPSPDGNSLYFSRQTMMRPQEIHRVPAAGGEAVRLTSFNEETLAGIEMYDAEEFSYEGAKGARVHGFLLKPPGFREGETYPTVFLIHGGPQGAFGRDFHDRWNAQLFASPGFVVVMINPRGSTGYGQAFTDAINGQWGGDCYEDLVRGFDHVLATYTFCDRERTAAAGASFGGFMVNWIAGHTDRFRCLVSHDGIFNTEMMDYTTDELWFTEWEFGGAPWEAGERYRRYSPHLFVENMKTPTLVVQGEQDFRCTTAEGLGFFTALQRRGVPSRLLYFSDEGHWVVKPKNRRLWYKTVIEWLERYLKG